MQKRIQNSGPQGCRSKRSLEQVEEQKQLHLQEFEMEVVTVKRKKIDNLELIVGQHQLQICSSNIEF